MKIKLDENVPTSLGPVLEDLGHEVDSVVEEGLTGAGDQVVWAAAQHSGRFLVTQDLDFSDVRAFAPGTHLGIMLIRLKTPGRRVLIQRIRDVFGAEDTREWSGSIIVVSDTKVRIRRPPGAG